MAQPNKFRIKVARAALENPATPGVDAVPVATDAILLRDMTLEPVYDMVERNNERAFLGGYEEIVAAKSFKASFETELAGSGTQGVAPAWGPLIMACSFAETTITGLARIQTTATKTAGTGAFAYTKTVAPDNTIPRTVTLTCTTGGGSGVAAFTVDAPATSVDAVYQALAQVMTDATPFALTNSCTITPTITTPFVIGDTFTIELMPDHVRYTPVDEAVSSLSCYAHLSKRNHKMTYMRGNVGITQNAKSIPTFKFDMIALNAGIASEVNPPAATLTPWQKPVAVNAANTSLVALHGFDNPMHNFSMDAGVTASHVNLPGLEYVSITNRAAKGSITIQDPLVSEVDYHAIVDAVALGQMRVVHGTVPGNIVEIRSTRSQLKNPQYVDKDGDTAMSFDVGYIPSDAGLDEIAILVY